MASFSTIRELGSPAEAGAIAWHAGESRCPPIEFPTGSRDCREWLAAWDAAEAAFEDAELEGPDLGGWSVQGEMYAERRALGFTALD